MQTHPSDIRVHPSYPPLLALLQKPANGSGDRLNGSRGETTQLDETKTRGKEDDDETQRREGEGGHALGGGAEKDKRDTRARYDEGKLLVGRATQADNAGWETLMERDTFTATLWALSALERSAPTLTPTQPHPPTHPPTHSPTRHSCCAGNLTGNMGGSTNSLSGLT
jgi:hypothetical protein